MTEEELANAAKLMAEAYDRLAAGHAKYVESVIQHTDMMKDAIQSIKTFEDRMDLRLKLFDERLDMNHTVLDSLQALVPAPVGSGRELEREQR